MDSTVHVINAFFCIILIFGIPLLLFGNEDTLQTILNKVRMGIADPQEEQQLKNDLINNPAQKKIFGISELTIDEQYAHRRSIFIEVYEAINYEKRTLQIKRDLTHELWYVYIPFAEWIIAQSDKKKGTYILGINGAQGSGKTTLSKFLQIILRERYHRNVVVFSIDDLYKPYEERMKMAREIHPLFATRGPGGTHDVQLGIDTITALKKVKKNGFITIPQFDKSLQEGKGDRLPKELWSRVPGPIDIVIFEGWNVGEKALEEQALIKPINDLEKYEDPEMKWRLAVNTALHNEYSRLFSLLDDLVMLKVSGIEVVRENRLLQERKLRTKLKTEAKHSQGKGSMSDEEIFRFIMFYERWTLHMLREMPERATLVFEIGKGHKFTEVYRGRLQKDIHKTCKLY